MRESLKAKLAADPGSTKGIVTTARSGNTRNLANVGADRRITGGMNTRSQILKFRQTKSSKSLTRKG
jgi:hypothetical protein